MALPEGWVLPPTIDPDTGEEIPWGLDLEIPAKPTSSYKPLWTSYTNWREEAGTKFSKTLHTEQARLGASGLKPGSSEWLRAMAFPARTFEKEIEEIEGGKTYANLYEHWEEMTGWMRGEGGDPFGGTDVPEGMTQVEYDEWIGLWGGQPSMEEWYGEYGEFGGGFQLPEEYLDYQTPDSYVFGSPPPSLAPILDTMEVPLFAPTVPTPFPEDWEYTDIQLPPPPPR